MNSYSTYSIIFISISLISIVSLITLVIILVRSPACLTKWTLFQLCIAALGYSVSTLPTILIYGDDILTQAFTTNLCKIQFRVTLFFSYPLTLIPIALSFYLHGLLNHNLDVENKWFWTFTTITWILSLLYSSLILFVTRNDENEGVMVSRLYCHAYKVAGKRRHYWVYQLVSGIFIISIIFSRKFSRN